MTEGLNKVKIRGTILHVYRSEKNGTAVVTIGTGDNNRPNVTMLKGLAEYFIGEYKVGDMIMVEGNIQSNYRPGRGFRTSIIVDRILPLWHSPRRYENEFEVYGTVKSIVKLGNSHKVNVNVVCNGFTSTIPVTFNYNDYRLNAETGEPIRVSGLICTSSRTVGDRTLYYQNYVANGIL